MTEYHKIQSIFKRDMTVKTKTEAPPSATVVQTAPAQPVATPASVPASKAKNP